MRFHKMQLWLACQLRRLANWFDPPPPPPIPLPLDAITAKAKELTQLANAKWQPEWWQAKQRWVISELIDAFPTTSKRLLVRAIENALEIE